MSARLNVSSCTARIELDGVGQPGEAEVGGQFHLGGGNIDRWYIDRAVGDASPDDLTLDWTAVDAGGDHEGVGDDHTAGAMASAPRKRPRNIRKVFADIIPYLLDSSRTRNEIFPAPLSQATRPNRVIIVVDATELKQ